MSRRVRGRTLAVPALIAAVPALIAVGMLAAGCAGGGIPVREDPQLVARAAQAARDGSPVLFRDLAGGDWDRVHVFPGPPELELVESEIGAPLQVSGTYTPYEDGGVLVFTTNGVLQRAVRLDPYPFDGDAGSYSRTVLVARPYPGARSLEFLDPVALRAPRPVITPLRKKGLPAMSDPRVPLTGRSLRFAAGMFQDMARTRDAAACARDANVARAAAATSRNPLLCLARAAWWAAVADQHAAAEAGAGLPTGTHR